MDEPRFSSIGVSRLRMDCDGEGVTTLAAGFGCPLRCRYCLNPQCFLKERPKRIYTVRELIDEAAIDDLYFQATNGGIVFGGGEPLLQADFIHEFRRQCPGSWKISLESSLAVPKGQLQKVINDVDFFLIDIKDMNPQTYRKYTGKSIDALIGNLKYLAENADTEKVKLRIPLIWEFNTEADRQRSRAELEKMGFAHFDFFVYDVERPLEKRKKMIKT